MPAAYLTPTEAEARLTRHKIVGSPSQADLEIASDDLDGLGRFVGEKLNPAQHREFPRTTTVQDDVAGSVPPRVLDWVALRAHQHSEDDEPPVLSERISSIGVSYARGKVSRTSRLMANLLRFYRTGRRPARIT